MDKNTLKKYLILVIAIIVIVLGFYFVYYKNFKSNQSPNQINSNLESNLLGTTWIQLDQDGEETDFEINFRKTKENDPLHESFDYADYLHQRPGESGYWKVTDNTITIIATQSDFPPTIYRDVSITGDILKMSDSLNNLIFNFKRIYPTNK